ncbi:type II toxin-antitoxin system VapC family toxin [Allocoleopsis franciscana]|uniref:Putative nucleic acid-binding protein, contains PIN domain n=1 Tax=Allocoleopsis franciscana PCC 7113 TaxID=1173027 RepID=K9WEY7_9CYAN|nr:type II toxin-antitoxin system VapC family toxin [Allocoleopsis franciscana]AFZ18778.1 putative nucleic acid-binding protein, contains PIN domain [Allocoleopsis franciscana PCC 7113]
MAIYFLDSSALVKRYISETGSAWVLGLFDPTLDNEFFVAAITGVEIVAAITRRTRNGSISAADAKLVCNQLRNDLQTDYQVVEIIEGLINSGMALAETHGLRGYDAVQLAAGYAVNELCIANGLPSIILVSADDELNLAAVNEGLLVENPNDHP